MTAPTKLQEWALEADSQARIDKIKTKEQLRAEAHLQMRKMELLTNDDAESATTLMSTTPLSFQY